MYYLVNVDQNSMAAHISPVMTMMGVKCCTSNAVDGTDDMWWNGSEEGGNVRGECEKMQALTVKMETVTLINRGRQNLTCYMYSVYEINRSIFFLNRCFILGGGGGHHRFGQIHFPLTDVFLWGSS